MQWVQRGLQVNGLLLICSCWYIFTITCLLSHIRCNQDMCWLSQALNQLISVEKLNKLTVSVISRTKCETKITSIAFHQYTKKCHFLNNIQIKVQYKWSQTAEAFWYIITLHLKRMNIFCASAIAVMSLRHQVEKFIFFC